jgi:hypothetical protein
VGCHPHSTVHAIDAGTQDVWLDSTWWLLDSAADRFAALDDGIIPIVRVGCGRDAAGSRSWRVLPRATSSSAQPAGAPGRRRPLGVP